VVTIALLALMATFYLACYLLVQRIDRRAESRAEGESHSAADARPERRD